MAKQDALTTTQISVTVPDVILAKMDAEVQEARTRAIVISRQEIIRQLLAEKYMQKITLKEEC